MHSSRGAGSRLTAVLAHASPPPTAFLVPPKWPPHLAAVSVPHSPPLCTLKLFLACLSSWPALCVPKSRSLSRSRLQPCPQDCPACMIVGTCISLLSLLQQRTTAQRGLISNSSGGCRSEVKVSAGLVSSKVPLLGL